MPRALVESSWKAFSLLPSALSTATSSVSITSSLAPPVKHFLLGTILQNLFESAHAVQIDEGKVID